MLLLSIRLLSENSKKQLDGTFRIEYKLHQVEAIHKRSIFKYCFKEQINGAGSLITALPFYFTLYYRNLLRKVQQWSAGYKMFL